MSKRVVLMVLDGWGIAKNPEVSAIDKAHTPFMDSLVKNYPHSRLHTFGNEVGLPEGQMGNSEVGHMNLGAGRVVYQDLEKLNRAAQNGELEANTVLQEALRYAAEKHKNIHFMGLVSDGGVHSHKNHLLELVKIAGKNAEQQVFVHAFTDGRDCDPKSGITFIRELLDVCNETGAEVASVCGRYYAMDRDSRWERIKLAYDAMVHATGEHTDNLPQSIENSYADGVTDEFLKPLVHTRKTGEPRGKIEPGDVVINFNFRTDRGRQITRALTQESFPDYDMHKMNLHYCTMTRYDDTFTGVKVLFEKSNLENTLGEVLEKAGKTQLRMAETEKYPHVTYFFSGGREIPFSRETRKVIDSPKVATYDLKPEMSAYEVKDKLVSELQKQIHDFVCINFANPDMVGHTGVFEAAVKACETVDACVRDSVTAGLQNGYDFIILADHGNSDCMKNPDGSPHTAHTVNPVPCIYVSANGDDTTLKGGKLGDIAPTVLHVMNIDIPEEMTGNVLLSQKS